MFYSLRGSFDRETDEVKFRKIFDQNAICKDFYVDYQGTLNLNTIDGQPSIEGKWSNYGEGTSGIFSARLEPS